MKSPTDAYAAVVLHSGCALTREKHSWDECPAQKIYLRHARKTQTKLKSNGLVIGYWVKKKDLIQIKEQKGDFLGLLDLLIGQVTE